MKKRSGQENRQQLLFTEVLRNLCVCMWTDAGECDYNKGVGGARLSLLPMLSRQQECAREHGESREAGSAGSSLRSKVAS